MVVKLLPNFFRDGWGVEPDCWSRLVNVIHQTRFEIDWGLWIGGRLFNFADEVKDRMEEWEWTPSLTL